MSILRLSLRLLYRCVETWGGRRGLHVWWSLRGCLRGVPGANPRAIKVPGYPHAIWLRPGTSDVASFEQIFLRGALDGSCFPQDGALQARAQELGQAAVIVDGGANIGLSSVWFANAFPQGRIFAVEPDPANVAQLRRNAAPYPNIVPVEGALWDKPASLRIVNPDDAAWAFRVDEPSGASPVRPVPALSIGDLMGRAGSDELLIAKLIIQGAEKAVFRSNLEWLARTRLVIFMPNDWADPWGGAGRVAMSALSRLEFDWIIQGLCLFCYRDPASIASTAAHDRAISR